MKTGRKSLRRSRGEKDSYNKGQARRERGAKDPVVQLQLKVIMI